MELFSRQFPRQFIQSDSKITSLERECALLKSLTSLHRHYECNLRNTDIRKRQCLIQTPDQVITRNTWSRVRSCFSIIPQTRYVLAYTVTLTYSKCLTDKKCLSLQLKTPKMTHMANKWNGDFVWRMDISIPVFCLYSTCRAVSIWLHPKMNIKYMTVIRFNVFHLHIVRRKPKEPVW